MCLEIKVWTFYKPLIIDWTHEHLFTLFLRPSGLHCTAKLFAQSDTKVRNYDASKKMQIVVIMKMIEAKYQR